SRTLGTAGEDTTTCSSHFSNTVSSRPLARAQVTLACDMSKSEKLPPKATEDWVAHPRTQLYVAQYNPRRPLPMTGIQFVTDEKGRKVAVQIDLKRYGAMLEDFWDGLISESRRKEKGIPLAKIKADLVKRGRLRE